MESAFTFKKVGQKETVSFLGFFKKSIGKLFSDHYSTNSISYIIDLDYGPKWLKSQLKKKKKNALVALDKEKIVGYLMVSSQNSGVAFANWLAVDRQYWRQGIASTLLDMWEKDALKEGAHSLFLWTTKSNLDFYRGRGFSVGGEFPNSWHGLNSFLIYKNLREPKEENFLKHYLKNKKNES